MMSGFLATHREELLRRCVQKVSERPARHATEVQVRNGIPLFLAQLQRTLEAEATTITRPTAGAMTRPRAPPRPGRLPPQTSRRSKSRSAPTT